MRPDRSILIIEDDRDIREMLAELLELEGFRILTAENGKEGLEKLQELSPPCLILLDLFMPVMNGIEFLAEIKKTKTEGLTLIPILVVTAGVPTAPEVQKATKIANGVVRKPIDFEPFLAMINKLLDKETQ